MNECTHEPGDAIPELISLIEDSQKKILAVIRRRYEQSWRFGVGILLWSPEGNKIDYALRFAFTATNNEAEYEALANGLTLQNVLGVEHIYIWTDSQLLVGQVKSDFKIDKRKERLVGYLRRVRKLAKLFRSCHMEHVPRERNQEVDRLSHLATAGYEMLLEATTMEWVEEEAFRTKEVMNNDDREGEGAPSAPWFQDVLDFLRTGVLPGDSRWLIRYRASA
ncbi:hypothetical protein LIER_23218 [Lithospermum erythrorhizon]|uniref:RNase H type-1 domain-containing protein n=1 Tax=Lithospermum erythrorhizon TaxID=34254 RepID=A0AAV3R024_LITER